MATSMRHRGWIHRLRMTTGALLLTVEMLLGTAATQPAHGQSYKEKTLHSFNGGADGSQPQALTLDAAGNLDGVTFYDGGGVGCGSGYDCGTVFVLNSAGREHVLYRFQGGNDGAGPNGPLIIDNAGNFYSTTEAGGDYGVGTLFKVSKSGKETVLYSFGSGAANPNGVIRDRAGNFYGTSSSGGSYGFGAVFKVDTAGKEKVLYSFSDGADGYFPTGTLVRDAAGNLYGTTAFGGSSNCNSGCGVVFKVDTKGNESTIYSFMGGSDGAEPRSNLIQDAQGNFYGTTSGLGEPGCTVPYSSWMRQARTRLCCTTSPVPGVMGHMLMLE